MSSKQGAYQKARRLKAEQVREPGERRTPEVAREHEKRVVTEERAERALLLVQERRFPLARQIGQLLLEHRDGLVLDSWAAYWLGEIAETIDDRDDPAKRARFTGGWRASSGPSSAMPGSATSPPPLPRKPAGLWRWPPNEQGPGKAGDECRVGRHEDRPARFQLAAWPARVADGTEESQGAKQVGEMAAPPVTTARPWHLRDTVGEFPVPTEVGDH